MQNHEEELLWLFEENFTDILKLLESWETELELMKEFSQIVP